MDYYDAEESDKKDVDIVDTLEDLYYESAPANTMTIAAGDDFGNLTA